MNKPLDLMTMWLKTQNSQIVFARSPQLYLILTFPKYLCTNPTNI